MNRKIILGGVFLSIFLMVSTAVALPLVEYKEHKKKDDEIQKDFSVSPTTFSNLFDLKEKFTNDDSFLENLSEFFANLTLRFQILFIILFRFPFQGIKNILSYAFVENHFVRSVFSELSQTSYNFTFKEKVIIGFTLFIRWPVQALVNIFRYAFLENSFFRSLFTQLGQVTTT